MRSKFKGPILQRRDQVGRRLHGARFFCRLGAGRFATGGEAEPGKAGRDAAGEALRLDLVGHRTGKDRTRREGQRTLPDPTVSEPDGRLGGQYQRREEPRPIERHGGRACGSHPI